MSPTAMVYTDAAALIGEGWRTLVEHFGLEKATQFVVLLERGKGDSVQEIADYWGNTSIDDIYAQVQTWKAGRSTTA